MLRRSSSRCSTRSRRCSTSRSPDPAAGRGPRRPARRRPRLAAPAALRRPRPGPGTDPRGRDVPRRRCGPLRYRRDPHQTGPGRSSDAAARAHRVASRTAGRADRRRAGGRVDVVRSVHRATNGNPLYIDSITHLLVAEERLNPATGGPGEPGGVASAAACHRACVMPRGSRLTYLDDESRSLLRVAAVIGRTFTLPVLGMVVDRTQDVLLDLLDDAVTRGTIRVERQRPEFIRLRAHPRPRRAVSRARAESAGGAALAGWDGPRAGSPRRPRSAPGRARPPLPVGDRTGTRHRQGDRVFDAGRPSERWPRRPTTKPPHTSDERSTCWSAPGRAIRCVDATSCSPSGRRAPAAATQVPGGRPTSRRRRSPASRTRRSAGQRRDRLCGDHRLPLQRPS